MLNYNNPLTLLLLGLLFGSCNTEFISLDDFNPSLDKPITILNGRFAVLDLLYLDSVPSANAQTINLENSITNNTLNLSAAVPEDSLYSSINSLLPAYETFGIAPHGLLNHSVDQLAFIQKYSPSDFALFNTNNGSNIIWNGCNSYANYFCPPVIAPEIFGTSRLDTGRYSVTIVNGFDFNLTIGISLKSNPSILFSNIISINKGDSSVFSFSVSDADVNGFYNWTIFQASSNGIFSGSQPINNSNNLQLKVKRDHADLSSGKFRPSDTLFYNQEVAMNMPVKEAKKLNFIQGRGLAIQNFINATGLLATNLKLERIVTDFNNDTLYSDKINVIATPAIIDWEIPLNNKGIYLQNGSISIRYKLYCASNGIIDISSNKAVSINHGFTQQTDITAIGFNFDSTYSFTSTTYPYNSWPDEFQVDFIPSNSALESRFKVNGWGQVQILSELNNYSGTTLKDSITLNLGNGPSDSSLASTSVWPIVNSGNNTFNSVKIDSVSMESRLRFKAPWGFRVKPPINHKVKSVIELRSSNGIMKLKIEKELDLGNGNSLDSLLALCDSVSLTAAIESRSFNPTYNSFSLSRHDDTLISLNNIYLDSTISKASKEVQVLDHSKLTNILKFNYLVDFASPDLHLKTTDSLYLDLSLALKGLL
tara:strand:+ start:7286 stop:9238 length:1953 start_codon:yes stop_codon:yes gene_type:complete